ncbi:hypothetical protein [Virgibacillus sp. SK37]|uniref:hypothetical protein n=1 Tax=Virgibacillus sp. SK37 TaxID=403957 RepID=UPI0011A4B015|nr:hypothetical protein [Virgibacillus sp. SK37]
MKILYSSLRELTPDQRNLLAEKYRVKKQPYIRDDVLAEKRGLSLSEYRKVRNYIERRLHPIILKNNEKYEDEFRKALELTRN